MALKRKNLARQAGLHIARINGGHCYSRRTGEYGGAQLMGNKEKADAQKATSDIVALEGSLDMYKLDNHRYPTTEQGLQRW